MRVVKVVEQVEIKGTFLGQPIDVVIREVEIEPEKQETGAEGSVVYEGLPGAPPAGGAMPPQPPPPAPPVPDQPA